VLATWGSYGESTADLDSPSGVAVNGQGDIWVTDTVGQRVCKFGPEGGLLFDSRAHMVDLGSGRPEGVAVDREQSVCFCTPQFEGGQPFARLDYLAGDVLRGRIECVRGRAAAFDTQGNRVVVGEGDEVVTYDAAGKVVSKWGSYGPGNAQLDRVLSVALDATGNLWIADASSCAARKFTRSGKLLARWRLPDAGPGRFDRPLRLATDRAGNVYVSDHDRHRVWKLSPSGRALATWGGEGAGDGQFRHPTGIAVDDEGSVYVADSGNHRVQKFRPKR
jgi:DNA-binding beta-propeller fold protein YncE